MKFNDIAKINQFLETIVGTYKLYRPFKSFTRRIRARYQKHSVDKIFFLNLLAPQSHQFMWSPDILSLSVW